MKGADLIQIAAAVYGIKWFDSVRQDVGLSEKELSELTKAEVLPGPIAYAMQDIATKYMARVESMHVNTKITDALMSGEAGDSTSAAYMVGLAKGMALVLAAIHGSPDELKELAHDKDFAKTMQLQIEAAS